MKGVFAAMLACAAAAGFGAPDARAGSTCGVPDAAPRWIDYAGHDAPFTPRPGMILAVSSGTEKPAAMRAAGAATTFFDLHLNARVGTTSAPADPATIPAKAKRLFDFAVLVTGCPTPIIAENELFGAQTQTPWSATNAQYRANVLTLLQELKHLGARPAITIANPPYTGGEAADWWRAAADAALLVRQVYFTRPNSRGLSRLGPARASRSMRVGMRGLVAHLTEIGIPASRIALELQFQSVLGQGGREGLQPLSAWLEVVKLEALAAKQVARETRIDSVWSWGWATFSTAGVDADKPVGVCVWLWARDPRLCNGPAAAGADFDASRTEGQLLLPRGVRCVLGVGRIRSDDVARTAALTGDRALAASALLERVVLHAAEPVDPETALAAQRALVRSRFGGSSARLRAALAAAHLGVNDLRSILADRVARERVLARLPSSTVRRREIDDFLVAYGSHSARLVETATPAPWLGGARRGWVVDSLAPALLFSLPSGRRRTVETVDGRFVVRALGPAVPLALLPERAARAAAAAALASSGKGNAYATWLDLHERAALAPAVCLRDQIPSRGPVDLASFVPALGL